MTIEAIIENAHASTEIQHKTATLKPEKFPLSHAWFLQHGWQPFSFQQQVWQAVNKGKSGMLHATTGAGKTYAVWMAAIEHFAKNAVIAEKNGAPNTEKPVKTAKRKPITQPLTVYGLRPCAR